MDQLGRGGIQLFNIRFAGVVGGLGQWGMHEGLAPGAGPRDAGGRRHTLAAVHDPLLGFWQV